VLDSGLSRERRAHIDEAVVGGAIVAIERDINRAESLVDGIEKREVAALSISARLR